MSNEVKRFSPEYCEAGGVGWAEMQEDAEGAWCKASDYDAIAAELAAIRAAGGEQVEVCDGKEQEAFEEFAKGQKMDMAVHPMHWLFLNKETYAARQGWKAAIGYCAAQHQRIVAALPPLAGKVSVPRELLAKWLVHVEARERQYDEIYTEGDKLRALLATPSMEVKS